MIFFGHIGFTLAAARVSEKLMRKLKRHSIGKYFMSDAEPAIDKAENLREGTAGINVSGMVTDSAVTCCGMSDLSAADQGTPNSMMSDLVVSNRAMAGNSAEYRVLPDYRFVLIGSIFPDIFDKTILFFLGDGVRSGRAFGHSLLFSLSLVLVGWLILRTFRRDGVLMLGCTGFFHLVLDQMWRRPEVLFWLFEKSHPAVQEHVDAFKDLYINVLQNSSAKITLNSIEGFFRDPAVFMPELIGFCILIYFVCSLIHNGQLGTFIRTGKW